MSATRIAVQSSLEKRLALIHRVIVPDKEYPKEYAVMVTDQQSIFIRQQKTRSSWMLRQEMRFGTALVTDVPPKTLEDYQGSTLETIAAASENLTVPHDAIISLSMMADPLRPRRREFFVSLVMKRQKEIFQVYNFEIKYKHANKEAAIKFYAVPLGAYVKPRRQTQTRETILREYAADILRVYRTLIPTKIPN